MKRTFVLIPLVGMAILMMYLASLFNYIRNLNEVVTDHYNNRIVNYCSDAATIELLKSSDVGSDYANLSDIKVDPDIAIDEYSNALCLSLGMLPTKEAKRDALLNYCKIITVAAYDGYYVYEAQKSKDSTYEFYGTPKLPYSYKEGNNIYALSLGGDKCWKLTKPVGGASTMTLTKVDSPITKGQVNQLINTTISEDLNYRIQQLYKNGWSGSILLPGSISNIARVNPIDGPSVLSMVNLDNTSVTFGIGGSKIIINRAVAAYSRDGVGYYSYSDLIPEGAVTISEVFDNIYDAAKAGYLYDFTYMK